MPHPLHQSRRWQSVAVAALFATVLTACGGSGNDSNDQGVTASLGSETLSASPSPIQSPSPSPVPASPAPALPAAALAQTAAPTPSPMLSPTTSAAAAPAPAATPAPAGVMSQRDAVRLADQASFGPTEALVAMIRGQGASRWISVQLTTSTSHYTRGGGGEIHQHTSGGDFCNTRGPECWRDYASTEPLLWDFYRNAIGQPDQLRQRVAFALQQILVVNNLDVSGTYGFRNYNNVLLREAFGNYRQVLKKVAMSPVMGDFLNNVNNDKNAPNENFARELLQLFSIGTCQLNGDGTLRGGACAPTYTNETVRSYAYALTGWTYPVGGRNSYGCWPTGANCRYYGGVNDGDMVPIPRFRDTAPRTLLNGYTVAANQTAPQALEAVLDSVMAHPNTAPFIGKQLIQHLVTSNPSPAYVARVAAAFTSGRYASFGAGQRGDLAATVAAILLDPEARGDNPGRTTGKLREPALLFTGVLRGMNGYSDGEGLSWYWGDTMRQHVFRAPSVFNFYPPDYPVAGTSLVGPTFGIHNANTALARLNFLTYALDWAGSDPSANIPNALGTKTNLSVFTNEVDPALLVDRISLLALGKPLPTASRNEVIRAVSWWTAQRDATNWKLNRVRTAAFLIYGSPHYQIQR